MPAPAPVVFLEAIRPTTENQVSSETMSIVRLIYASTLSKTVDPPELTRIHETAVEHNAKNFISGMLIFGNDYFLQCLEGSREAVNGLYSKIAKDARHEHIMLLEYSEISERSFDQWAMKLVLMKDENTHAILRYSVSGYFDPYALSSASALQLMRALRR